MQLKKGDLSAQAHCVTVWNSSQRYKMYYTSCRLIHSKLFVLCIKIYFKKWHITSNFFKLYEKCRIIFRISRQLNAIISEMTQCTIMGISSGFPERALPSHSYRKSTRGRKEEQSKRKNQRSFHQPSMSTLISWGSRFHNLSWFLLYILGTRMRF